MAFADETSGDDRTLPALDDSSLDEPQQPSKPTGLTVTFKDVNVQVNGLGQDYGPTVWSVVTDLLPWKQRDSTRHILQDVSGQVLPGEMLLVLGRPGSGCTSLLKIIANMRKEFLQVNGEVRYGNIDHKKARRFRNHIVMNTEDDQHFPTLKVSEVMEFATRTKVPRTVDSKPTKESEYISGTTIEVLDSLGISHTADTMVGDEFIRGVSGGERKRVSLAEVIATQGSVQCWDNSTRGLDASNALDFARVLRRHADTENKTVIATLYQAGNGIFDLFDKVLVLVDGQEIFYGPTSKAKQYFEDMGFVCAPGANIADFLTSVAVEAEREVVTGLENEVPTTASELRAAYVESSIYSDMVLKQNDMTESQLASEVEYLDSVRQLQKKRMFSLLSREHSVYQVSFYRQVLACTTRQFQILWGDRWTNFLKLASTIIVAFQAGSANYHLEKDSDSLFMRSSVLFFPLLYFGLNSMSEVTASFLGRPIFSRHKRFALSRPAAQAIACTIADIPFIVMNVSLFDIILFFLCNFDRTAAKFFTQWFIYIVSTLCLTSFFRMLGAWSRHFGIASQISGCCTMIMMVYGGYLIPIPKMKVWFRWIAYIDPVAYGFAAAMGSETGNLDLECVEPQLIPYGPGYDNQSYRGCTTAGSSAGLTDVSGYDYLDAQYGESTRHVWRNIGIIVAFWVFFAGMAALGCEMNLHQGEGSKILFDKAAQQKSVRDFKDLEKGDYQNQANPRGEQPETTGQMSQETTFTFRDISYHVHYLGAEKQLLDKVSGYVRPGQLVALMGSSGAGKTTLMDVLSQRKDSGRIEGSIMVNGKPQGISFQRMTGYCEQNDVHEPTATVREALLFAARLRQSHKIPDVEKVEYVESIMGLLELKPLQHAIVGSPGSGLSIEQRKRLTIATELVAKPSLLFLDEPTSGLDGQSAYGICQFMRKLAATGQTIICTIHQPSAVLFDAFDVLLLLAKGGKTTYFGPTGTRSSIVLDYFAQRGEPCPEDLNPAEHIVNVVQGRYGTDSDWPQLWLESSERQKTMEELSVLEKQNYGSGDSTEEANDFATPLSYQVTQVTKRQFVALWRNPDYVWNKIGLHISNGLFGGFTFWMIGNGSFDMQLRLMSVFNFIFVAPGCINQLQPLFIRNRDMFETREKKSKTYRWLAFIAAQLVSEIPILIICATLFFACWYFTSGFPVKASSSGAVYLQMIFYEFLYTSIGQAIAAYSPNALFAALANPLIIGTLISFCGVVVPYSKLTAFWKYWLYYLNPFTYLVGGLLTPVAWDVKVECLSDELTYIPLPSNITCGEYIYDFLVDHAGYVVDAENTTTCSYCPYSNGGDYLRTLFINEKYYGWRNIGLTAMFCISSYACVFIMMKMRTKATKTAN